MEICISRSDDHFVSTAYYINSLIDGKYLISGGFKVKGNDPSEWGWSAVICTFPSGRNSAPFNAMVHIWDYIKGEWKDRGKIEFENRSAEVCGPDHPLVQLTELPQPIVECCLNAIMHLFTPDF